MEESIDELLLIYDRLIEILEQLSLNAEEQKQKLKDAVVTDELALDYSEIAMLYVKKLFKNHWISQEQLTLAEDIDEKLEQMSQDKALWNEEALKSSLEWEKCRLMAQKLLKTLKENLL